jgi:hypothetical protein
VSPYEQFLVSAGVVVGLVVLFFGFCIFCGFIRSSQLSRQDEVEEARRTAGRWLRADRGWGEAE